jgi:hypothetical protein
MRKKHLAFGEALISNQILNSMSKVSFKDICSSIQNILGCLFLTELTERLCLGYSARCLLVSEEFGVA